ncbi:hypothetical protein PGIGA_G00172790 [Pangasianodon gigas]|uniref:Uncharacterized protein n=1 Tax=Pangasianodon gigas TaxID=30993 RepID=A0ACC5XV60_PANGG|nr:hypothetical protein [Pangasianodon gigas]
MTAPHSSPAGGGICTISWFTSLKKKSYASKVLKISLNFLLKLRVAQPTAEYLRHFHTSSLHGWRSDLNNGVSSLRLERYIEFWERRRRITDQSRKRLS